MSDQAYLRKKIAGLEELQRRRRELIDKTEKEMEEIYEVKQRELDNLRAQLTIGVAK